MTRIGEQRARSRSEMGLQLFAVLGAPLAWATEFVLSYATTQHACSTGRFWQLYLLSALSLAVALAAVLVSARTYLAVQPTVSQDSGTGTGRSLFMATLGLLVSSFFTLVIVAEAVPRFILSPCD